MLWMIWSLAYCLTVGCVDACVTHMLWGSCYAPPAPTNAFSPQKKEITHCQEKQQMLIILIHFWEAHVDAFFRNKVCVLFLQYKRGNLQISEIHYTLLSKPNPLKTHLKTLFLWFHWHCRAEMTHFTLREFALWWLMVLLRLLKVCPQENYIAQRLLFYVTGDLIEFSVIFYWSSTRCVL